MKTVLLAWELGAGFGHVGPLLRVARELKRLGHKPVFALRDVVGPSPLFAGEEMPILQAPRWIGEGYLRGRSFRMSGYSDVLAVYGFSDAEVLCALTESWDALIGLIKPDLIVADHSPALCLAALGSIPVAVVGNGYTVPPIDAASFPSLYPERPPLMAEGRLLENVREVQRRRGRPAPASLPALFAASVRAVGTMPELDPYRRIRREPVLGPLAAMPQRAPLPEAPRLFAYLGEEHPGLDALVQAVAEFKGEIEVYLRGGSVGVLRRLLAMRGAVVHENPPSLAEAVTRATVVASHAGSSTAHAALIAGRPQVLFPAHIEADLTAEALVALKAGIRLPPTTTAADAARALADASSDSEIRMTATACARAVAARPQSDALAETAAACAKLLA